LVSPRKTSGWRHGATVFESASGLIARAEQAMSIVAVGLDVYHDAGMSFSERLGRPDAPKTSSY